MRSRPRQQRAFVIALVISGFGVAGSTRRTAARWPQRHHDLLRCRRRAARRADPDRHLQAPLALQVGERLAREPRSHSRPGVRLHRERCPRHRHGPPAAREHTGRAGRDLAVEAAPPTSDHRARDGDRRARFGRVRPRARAVMVGAVSPTPTPPPPPPAPPPPPPPVVVVRPGLAGSESSGNGPCRPARRRCRRRRRRHRHRPARRRVLLIGVRPHGTVIGGFGDGVVVGVGAHRR